jgi:Ca-activated chloride channel homolog
MTFVWPQLLWLMLLVPLLVLLYVWLLQRKARHAVQFSHVAMVRAAAGKQSRIKRHVPPALMLLALSMLLLAAARPMAVVTLPMQQETIMLAMDVSGSMRATDVLPNRLVAAQNAAKAFLSDLPRSVKVGIVSFAGTASLVQAPTVNREDLVAAIDRFQMQRGTAIGNGIVVSLATLFPDAGIDLAQMQYGNPSSGRPLGSADKAAKPAGAKDKPPVPPGSYTSAAIILLTDGQRTTGVDPLEAAQLAANKGVRVYTVGIGTKDGETIGFEGWSMRVRLDEDSLKAISSRTQAEYFYAGTAEDLKKVYGTLSSRLTVEKKETEVTALLALAGALLALVAGVLSMWWFNRMM